MDRDKALVVFQDKRIRRIWYRSQWFFSVIDAGPALTDSDNPRNYWSMLKTREAEQGIGLSMFCVQVKRSGTTSDVNNLFNEFMQKAFKGELAG